MSGFQVPKKTNLQEGGLTTETFIEPPRLPEEPGGAVDAIIRTKGLTKQFGDEVAVDDVTFYVPRGSIFGFIGPSGSGKTTTIRMLIGFYAPTSGEALVLGSHPIRFRKPVRSRIGYMPQLFVLYPNLSVWENLSFAASIYGMSWFRSKHLKRVLEFVELYEHKHKLANQISGGMQRRLSLAATLVHNPDLIFLDEPTAGIDPVLRQKFWEHFRELRDQGRTLFITTQYVSEAAYCDLVGVMAEGKLLMVDTPEQLRHKAYGGDIVILKTTEPLDYAKQRLLAEQPPVKRVIRDGENSVRMVVDDASTAVPTLLEWCRQEDIPVESIEEIQPPFEEVFIELVQKGGNHA